MKNFGFTTCTGCGHFRAIVVLEPKYNGLRGRCSVCAGDWPES